MCYESIILCNTSCIIIIVDGWMDECEMTVWVTFYILIEYIFIEGGFSILHINEIEIYFNNFFLINGNDFK